MNAYGPAALPIDWLQLTIALIVTLGASTAVALMMRAPLHAVLQLTCSSEITAKFWTMFASILLVIGPLFIVFTAATGTDNMAEFLRHVVYQLSFAIIGAFLIMGAAVMMSVPRDHNPGQDTAAGKSYARKPVL